MGFYKENLKTEAFKKNKIKKNKGYKKNEKNTLLHYNN